MFTKTFLIMLLIIWLVGCKTVENTKDKVFTEEWVKLKSIQEKEDNVKKSDLLELDIVKNIIYASDYVNGIDIRREFFHMNIMVIPDGSPTNLGFKIKAKVDF